ncbi:MAG: hypothetical protein CMK59_02860 [Proteobacteria bacterium]|nr:hypothetical protein [Pseudomonadota bacterium]
MTLLTRFEVARIVGLRSLQLSEGSQPRVQVVDSFLRQNSTYVAALELKLGVLDARVVRGKDEIIVSTARMPLCLDILLDTHDGGERSYSVTSVHFSSD